MRTRVERSLSEAEIRAEIESRGLTVSAVYRTKTGLYGHSHEKKGKGIHAYPRCSVSANPILGVTEIEEATYA